MILQFPLQLDIIKNWMERDANQEFQSSEQKIRKADSSNEMQHESSDFFSNESKSYQQENHLARKKTRRYNDQSSSNNWNKGHWEDRENFCYYQFLQDNHINFQRKNLRRSQKIFKVMSKYLGTRTADQCRSHHQKMEKKCLNFSNILEFLQKQFHFPDQMLDVSFETQKKQRKQGVPRCRRIETSTTIEQIEKQIQLSADEQEEFEMPQVLQPSSSKPNHIDCIQNELRIFTFNDRVNSV